MPGRRNARGESRESIWILPDQLSHEHPALITAAEVHARPRIVMIESRAWMERLPYHRKRQVLILSAGRHFAEELRQKGYEVDLIEATDTIAGLRSHVERFRPSRIVTMEATENAVDRRQRGDLADVLGVPVDVQPSALFLVDQFCPIPDPEPGRRYVMETFYRAMRKRFQILIEPDGTPSGGAWNFDAKNRKAWPKGKIPPRLPRFEPDSTTAQVIEEVEERGHGVGSAVGFDLPVSRTQALEAFEVFLRDRLPEFGPYEDAMSDAHGTLHHSLMSPAMNLGLIGPLEMVRAAEREYREGRAPIESVEGFVRQIIGWREFILWQYRRQMPGLRDANAWKASRPLPKLLWDGDTDLRCLSRVVERLLESGFTHHIERLMIVCNFCLLAGVDPAAVADWFLTFYVDSHDWVVLPNVIGMGLNADGGITATKPYIASASYIKKMSDFCKSCRYDPEKRVGPDACPFNALYWNFLIDHEAELRANPRLGPAVLGLSRLNAEQRREVQTQARTFLASLEAYTDLECGSSTSAFIQP